MYIPCLKAFLTKKPKKFTAKQIPRLYNMLPTQSY